VGVARESWLKQNALLFLLVFVPIALILEHVLHVGGLWVFVTSALAIIPLAGLMGRATEHLAARLGEGVGGLINATFGNAAELIIAIIALRETWSRRPSPARSSATSCWSSGWALCTAGSSTRRSGSMRRRRA
jgi:Ca2+/H+ antiporter